MTKHTPGPWRVEFSGPCSWLIRSDGVHLPGTDENARLIRQAPEMLEALTALVAECRRCGLPDSWSGDGADGGDTDPLDRALRLVRGLT
jgi:hypothetical protein